MRPAAALAWHKDLGARLRADDFAAHDMDGDKTRSLKDECRMGCLGQASKIARGVRFRQPTLRRR
jgi:hypothetical protein